MLLQKLLKTPYFFLAAVIARLVLMALTLSRKLIRLLDRYQGLLIRSASQGSKHGCNVLAGLSILCIRTIIDMAPREGVVCGFKGTAMFVYC